MLKSTLGQLRLFALLEGYSWIALFTTMYLKYGMQLVFPNKIAGMLHGVLFIAYCVYAYLIYSEKQINTKKLVVLLACSIVPFLTFWADKKILKNLQG